MWKARVADACWAATGKDIFAVDRLLLSSSTSAGKRWCNIRQLDLCVGSDTPDARHNEMYSKIEPDARHNEMWAHTREHV